MIPVLGGEEEGAVSWTEEPTDELVVAGLLADGRPWRFERLVETTGFSEARVEAALDALRARGEAQNVLGWMMTTREE